MLLTSTDGLRALDQLVKLWRYVHNFVVSFSKFVLSELQTLQDVAWEKGGIDRVNYLYIKVKYLKIIIIKDV